MQKEEPSANEPGTRQQTSGEKREAVHTMMQVVCRSRLIARRRFIISTLMEQNQQIQQQQQQQQHRCASIQVPSGLVQQQQLRIIC
jgi:hypothetical protein